MCKNVCGFCISMHKLCCSTHPVHCFLSCYTEVGLSACLVIGTFKSKNSCDGFPFAIPLDCFGFLKIKINDQLDRKVALAVEKWLLDFLMQQPESRIISITTKIIDAYPALSLLKKDKLYMEFSTIGNIDNGFDFVKKILFKHRTIVSDNGFMNIFEYNEESVEKLPFVFVLLPNLNDILSLVLDRTSIEHFLDVVRNGYLYGLVFLYMDDGSNIRRRVNFVEDDKFIELINFLNSTQPLIVFNNEGISFEGFHPIVEKLVKSNYFGFDINFGSPDSNMEFVRDIKRLFDKNEEISNEDFLRIPVGLSDGKEVSISLGKTSSSYHVAISGATGSGKSTFIESLLLKIFEKYDFNHINIDLIDFKRSIMAQPFLDNPNRIITGIMKVDPSFSTVKNLLNNYTRIVNARIDYFREHKCIDIHDFNKKYKSYPYKVVVFDEAHNIFDVANIMSRMELEKQLEKLLRESRAAGVSFIFSTQTYRGGDSGFTSIAKEQIKVRLAFKAGSEGDSLLMVGDESAYKLKNNPGKGIYKFIMNDDYGVGDANTEVIAEKVPTRDVFLEKLKSKKDDSYVVPIKE